MGFSIVAGTGGFRAATFFATTPVSREALDHRLLAPTASGVALCLCTLLHTLNTYVDTYLQGAVLRETKDEV